MTIQDTQMMALHFAVKNVKKNGKQADHDHQIHSNRF